MAEFEIQHDRPNCIGCTACASIAPEYWTMNPDDGKSDVVGAPKNAEGWEVLVIPEDKYEQNKMAADSCPVNVIHLVNKTTGEKLI
jgi:ferredoxin